MAAPLNFAASLQTKSEDASLRVVQLDGLAVLKIIKHCKESMPAVVTGQLLGLDIGQTLEITDCFPFPVRLWCTMPGFQKHKGRLRCLLLLADAAG